MNKNFDYLLRMTRHKFSILKIEQIKIKYQDLILSTYVICTNNRLLKIIGERKYLLIKLLPLVNKNNLVELEHHHFTTIKELMLLGIEHQWQ